MTGKRYRDMGDMVHMIKSTTAKRYQVRQPDNKLPMVVDTWTKTSMGIYPTKEQAQARARTLNSRNGGK